jgi:hypothetical protein
MHRRRRTFAVHVTAAKIPPFHHGDICHSQIKGRNGHDFPPTRKGQPCRCFGNLQKSCETILNYRINCKLQQISQSLQEGIEHGYRDPGGQVSADDEVIAC